MLRHSLLLHIFPTTKRGALHIRHNIPTTPTVASISAQQPRLFSALPTTTKKDSNNSDNVHEINEIDRASTDQIFENLRKKRVPTGFWRNPANHRLFFEWAARQLNINKYEDWYSVTRESIVRIGGESLLTSQYRGSFIRAISTVFPEHEWQIWRFEAVPPRFWSKKENHKMFFDWAAKKLGVSKFEDWYSVAREDVIKLGGHRILQLYDDSSLHTVLSNLYPEFEWQPWRFDVVPRGYWSKKEHHIQFFEWIAKQLNVKQFPDDWYKVSREDVLKLGAGYVIRYHYGNNLCTALATLYPQYEWLPWRFLAVPPGFWADLNNRRRFFDWVAKQLNLQQRAQWYYVKRDTVIELGGSGILYTYYCGSLVKALEDIYPDFEWQPWRFQNFVASTRNAPLPSDDLLHRYVEHMARQLQIEQLDDWYRVSSDQIRKLGGYNIIAQHGGLYTVLKKVYPEHTWSEEQFFGKGKRAAQRWLKIAAQRLLPNEEIFEEYHHSELFFEASSEPITLDIWIPSLSLALEYHGAQHYHDVALFGNPAQLQQLDAQKAITCKKAGVTLVAIPYWWNRSIEDLAATICKARPDLFVSPSHSALAKAAALGTPIEDCHPPPPTLEKKEADDNNNTTSMSTTT